MISFVLCTCLREQPGKITWDEAAAEHVFEYRGEGGQRRRVFYPSLASIQARLALALERGAGVSIWELGQGLDYFMDLL